MVELNFKYIEESERFVKIGCGNIIYYIPSAIYESKSILELIDWIIENKYTKIEKISVETPKAVKISGAWISKVFIVEYNNAKYAPNLLLGRIREEL